MSMTSLLDSEATFVQKATDGGLSEPFVDATFAKLSFAITTPGETATDAQVNTFLTTTRPGVNPTISDLAAFKRLLLESQTIMIQNARSAVKGDEQGLQRTPQPERDAYETKPRKPKRHRYIRATRASPFPYVCFETIEKNQIAYINPNRCLSSCNLMHRRQDLLCRRNLRIQSST